MANQNVKRHLIGMKLGTPGVFKLTDYECELKIQKFKMKDPIWRNRTFRTAKLKIP